MATEESPSLKLYTNYLSPVCRAVMWLLEVEQIPYEERIVNLAKNEHLGDSPLAQELARINPNRRIPSMDDGGFHLFESVAIMQYLCAKHNLPDHWYPADFTKRALVDQYLSWHTGNLRCKVFFLKCIEPSRVGKFNERRYAEQLPVLKKSIDILDSFFLKNRKYIAGDEISIADILCLSEITQYWMTDNDLQERGANIKRWVEDCRQALNPHFDKINKSIYDVRKAGTFKTTFDL